MRENNHKRKWKIAGLILGIAVVVIIGIGYAATYQGETSVSNNTSESTHIVMTIDSNQSSDYTAKFCNHVYYDTITNSSGTRWIPQFDTDTDKDGEDDAVVLGTVTLNTVQTGEGTYFITMSKTSGTMKSATDYIVGVKIGSAAETFIDFDSNEFNIATGLTGDKSIIVKLYYQPETFTSDPGDALNGAEFKFIAYATD